MSPGLDIQAKIQVNIEKSPLRELTIFLSKVQYGKNKNDLALRELVY